ncbi:hypothetical protein EV702DRAFT_1095421 [Suillus placidus]|uniref:Uncharacterized protein n=1 Tax=Suillus placidus TaxID=48579 RepID=A0A9P7D401_9AGAM|nr:hypothetical protein EV702DRAFT_1095421 [Suillus placidus]
MRVEITQLSLTFPDNQSQTIDLGLKNIHVLVTGTSGGIGLETVKLDLSLGANVTAHYNSNSTPLQALQVSFPAFQCAQADLSSDSAVKESDARELSRRITALATLTLCTCGR